MYNPQDIALYILSLIFIAYGAYYLVVEKKFIYGGIPLVVGIFAPYILPKFIPYFKTCMPYENFNEKVSLGEMKKIVSATLV